MQEGQRHWPLEPPAGQGRRWRPFRRHEFKVVPKIVFTKQIVSLLQTKQLGRTLRQEETQAVLAEVEGLPILVSTDDYVHVFKAFSKLNLWSQVVQLWQTMRQEGLPSNSRASGHLAESFIRGGKWAASLVILDSMHVQRLGLGFAAQGAALAVYRSRHLWQAALNQFMQDGSFTMLTIKRMFMALADANQIDLLKQLLKLLSRNERTAHNAQRVAANAFAEAGLWQDASALMEETRAQRMAAGQQLLEKVMGAKLRAARWREACFLVSQLPEDAGFSVVLLSNAVGACSQAARLGEALRLLQLMRMRGYWPTVRTFNLVLLACARAGSLQQALEVLAEMRFAMRDPDIISYSTCISAAEKERDWASSLVLLERIQTAGLRADAIAISTTMKICEKGLEWEHPLQLLMQMYRSTLQPDTVTTSSVLRTFQEGMRWKDNCQLLHEILQRPFPDDIKAHNSAASALEKVSKWQRALGAVEYCGNRGLQADLASFGVMLGACAEGGNFLLAVDGLQALVRRGFRISPQFLGMALEAGREDHSTASAVAALLGQLKESIAAWLHRPSRHSEEAMLGVRESSTAVEVLQQYGALESDTYQAFRKRACRPVLAALHPRKWRAFAKPKALSSLAELAAIGSLGMPFTLDALDAVKALGGMRWSPTGRGGTRRLLAARALSERPGASSATVTAWSSYVIQIAAGRPLMNKEQRPMDHSKLEGGTASP
ncbi:unnamed protein product, partial [Symbiodinium natans]